MDIKYCLPIQKASKEEIIKIISENPDYDFYEIWLDYVNNLNPGFVDLLLSEYGEKIIFVLRRNNLEKVKMDFDERKKYMDKLANSKAYLDLDIEEQREEINFLLKDKLNIKLIASYHNYQNTPDDKKLDSVVSKMMEIKPAIFKISTFCNTPEDALVLLEVLLALNNEGVRKIVLGMGENGLITRIFGTLWGNEMIFAPLKVEDSSAEGQMTKKDLEIIFERIKNGR